MTLMVNSDLDPLDLCHFTVAFILQLGTVNEIVKHQPDNAQALEKKQYLESGLKIHLSECEKCRTALKDE